MKTFIYHDGALGDLLLSLPCLKAMKSGSSRVHLAARSDVARIGPVTQITAGDVIAKIESAVARAAGR